MRQTWIEGQQYVQFPSSWQCIKLDEHRYYKRISGRGIKCVDYLAIDPNWGLYLIELKDYPQKAKVPFKEEHQTTLLAKKAGSIKLIKTVNAALRRQWYYRLIFLRLKIYRICPDEWQVWYMAEKCIDERRLVVVGDFAIR